ncbi:uncharacterized protein TNIN_89441 [Trichonephila inaurata madagascariensis]|uniref:Ig-like domain-containing protein n=1 Tax=Trichonephila inaurata madagascariensis TaxID=2747483 RepID=A0A8X6XP42_9ARAC|nr:uncharacterized protein TNIN_89441 [Trichonephila inaurata madagascariensis]
MTLSLRAERASLQQTADGKVEPPLVEAVVGGTASIPCNVTLEDDEATLILWYRSDLPNPIYTLDVRNTSLRNARRFPSSEIGNRTNFDIAAQPPTLLLSNVTTSDAKDYRCRVDLRRYRTLILHTRLRVIVPPNEPIMMDEHGQHLHGVVGPYDEGSTLTFICEVDGGDPYPNVTWWRGAVLFDDDFTIIKQRFVRNELVLRKVQRTELMMEYTCKASNTYLAKPITASFQLDLNLPHPSLYNFENMLNIK